ncbi:MAG: hypothetical protein WBC18_04185, partial [Ottowia sp.]
SSTAGCPQRSVGTRQVGSPFLGLPSFGDAKEGDCTAGGNPGLRPEIEQQMVVKKQGAVQINRQ